jgi:hypothetical protein
MIGPMRTIITTLLSAAAFLNAEESPMSITCLEIVTLRLAPGTDRAAFIAGARAVDHLLATTPGFRGRTLAEQPDGGWIDVVGWQDRAAADAAAAALPATAEAQAWFATMDPASITMRHLETEVARWPAGRSLTLSATGPGTITGRDAAGVVVLRWRDAAEPGAATVVVQRP